MTVVSCSGNYFSNCGGKVLSQLHQAGLNAFIVDAIDGDAFTSQDECNGKANRKEMLDF